MKKLLTFIALLGISTICKADEAADKAREVDKLLTHLGYDESLPRMLASMNRIFKTTYAALKIPDQVWDEIAKELSFEEMRAMSAKLYSDQMTLEEIKAANTFYETPIGRSYAAKSAKIGEQEFYQAREWGQKKASPILIRYLKSKGLLKEPPPKADETSSSSEQSNKRD